MLYVLLCLCWRLLFKVAHQHHEVLPDALTCKDEGQHMEKAQVLDKCPSGMRMVLLAVSLVLGGPTMYTQ